MFAHFQVEIKSPEQLAAVHEFWNRFGDYASAEPDEYGFRSHDLRTINETLCDGFGNTSRQLTDIKSGIDEIGDRLSRRNCRGKRRGKYDDETVSFCLGCLSAAEGNATIRNGLNTRLTHQAVFEYNRRELEARGIPDAAAFTRIIRAQQAREQRQRMKALDAARTCASKTRTVAPETRTVAPETRTCAPKTRSVASSTRTCAPKTRTCASATRIVAPKTRICASEDLPNSQVQNGGGNGILQTMKNGATTLALMAAMLCGLGVFCYDGV